MLAGNLVLSLLGASIHAPAASALVLPRAPGQQVSARTALQHVVALSSLETVVPGTAEQEVLPAHSPEHIVVTEPARDIGSRAAYE